MNHHVGDDLYNVLRLVTDSLHVRDHLHGRGNYPQVPGHRLLAQQQLHADGLDGTFALVDLGAYLFHLSHQVFIPARQ